MHKQLFPVQKQHPSTGMSHAKHVPCVHDAAVYSNAHALSCCSLAVPN